MINFSEITTHFDNITNAWIQNFFDVNQEHRERINRYAQFWNWYKGKHWAVGNDVDTITTLNYIKRIVDEKIVFFSKNGFEISVPEDPNQTSAKVDNNFVKVLLDDVWEKNNRDVFLMDAAQMAAVTGDCWIKPSVDQDCDGNDYIRLDVLSSSMCFPEFDTRDKKRVKRFHIIYPTVEENITFSIFADNRGNGSKRRIKWFRETYTKEKIEYFEDDVLLESLPNVLNEIPVIHIKNFPDTDSCFGISDVDVLRSVNKAYNEAVTDMRIIIDYYAKPQLFAKGIDTSDLEKGVDNIWSTSNVDADIKAIDVLDDLKPSIDFTNVLYRSLFDLSGVPEQAINPTKNVSNTPGVALHMAYLPIIHTRLVKIKAFTTGLKEVNRLILKMNSLLDPAFGRKLQALGTRKYNTELTFGEDLPRDEVQQLENKNQELTMGITTRKEVLLARGVGPTDADRILREADEDLATRLEIQARYNGKATEPAFGNRRKPDPVVQGDKVSRQ